MEFLALESLAEGFALFLVSFGAGILEDLFDVGGAGFGFSTED